MINYEKKNREILKHYNLSFYLYIDTEYSAHHILQFFTSKTYY